MRCKPGTIAVVLKAFHKENVGRIVECITLTDLHGYGNIPVWKVHCSTPLKSSFDGDTEIFYQNEGRFPDENLQPINDADPGKEILSIKELEDA